PEAGSGARRRREPARRRARRDRDRERDRARPAASRAGDRADGRPRPAVHEGLARRPLQPDVLRLHELPGRLPDHAAGPRVRSRPDRGRGAGSRAQCRVRQRRSVPRHAGADSGLPLGLRSVVRRRDRPGRGPRAAARGPRRERREARASRRAIQRRALRRRVLRRAARGGHRRLEPAEHARGDRIRFPRDPERLSRARGERRTGRRALSMPHPFVWLQHLLPQALVSRAVYRIARSEARWIKDPLSRWFARSYGVDLSEAEEPDPTAYRSFNEFFTRPLKPGAREIAPGETTIVSPVDGRLTEFGHARSGTLLQAKGFTYALEELIGEGPFDGDAFANGAFATSYLAPHAYHRVHRPLAGKLTATRYVPGRRFSVNAATTCGIRNLFCRNGRVVCWFDTAHGP